MAETAQWLHDPGGVLRRRRHCRDGAVNPMLILGILLAISVAGNGLLAKLYVGAKEDLAAETQAYASFKAQVKVAGEQARDAAKATEMADKLRKDTADAENAATVARLNAAVAKLRLNANRSVGGSVSKAPAGSRCPDGQTCFDTAAYQLSIRGFDTEARRLADECAAVEADLNTARRWAQTR